MVDVLLRYGTTSTRTLETIATDHDGKLCAASGWTDIFMYQVMNLKQLMV